MIELLIRTRDYIQAGGPVMWPLLAVSLWLWTLIIAKLIWVLRARRDAMDLKMARACLEGRAPAPAAAQGPLSAAVGEFARARGGQAAGQVYLWRAAVRRQDSGLGSRLTAIMVLGACAPLLGLLGTVSGMIETFQAIMLFGTGNAQALASGISQALITTQTGLLVAIPGLLAGHFLRRQTRKLHHQLSSLHRGLEAWLGSEGGRSCCA